MAAVKQLQRVASYTVSDAAIVLAFGILGGIVNVTISSIVHNHFMLWGARVPYGSFFTIAPVIVMLLLRKPGVALATALIYGSVQAIANGDLSNLLIGLLEGAGAEVAFALFRYRRFDALSAFLAGGIGAKTLENLWTMVTSAIGGTNAVATGSVGTGAQMKMGGMAGMSNAQAEQFAPWQTFLGGEILALLVVGVLSGLVGWALAKLIERTGLVERLQSRLDHTPAHVPQLPS